MVSRKQESRRHLTFPFAFLFLLFFIFLGQKNIDIDTINEVKYLEDIQATQEQKHGALEKISALESLLVTDICSKRQYRCVPGSHGKVKKYFFSSDYDAVCVGWLRLLS